MAQRNADGMAKLAEWMERLDSVASPQFKAANTREMSKATRELIEDGFRKESTPYGSKWRPKKIPNGEQILVEKNIMRHAFTVRVGSGQFSISNRQVYAPTHQYGDALRNIPRRQMWPSPNRLPASYIRAYQRIVTKRFFAILQKGQRA